MKKLIFLLLGGCGLAGCIAPNPDTSLSPDEKDIYLSNYSAIAKFSTYKTYALVDSVLYISQNNGSTAQIRDRQGIDVAILQTIDTEMAKLNFTRVSGSQNPDVIVDVSRVVQTSTQTGVYYPNYGYGYYGYGYGYGSYPVVYSYQDTQTSLNIDMFDVKNLTPDNKAVDVWSGVLLGDLLNDAPNLQVRLTNGIQSVFAQSPYLKNGK